MELSLIQQRMFEDARNHVRDSGQFKSVQNLAGLFGLDLNDLRLRLEAWKNRGEIFSIDDGDSGELFPVFAFDQTDGLRPHEAMFQLLDILANIGSNWAIAFWFIGLSSNLNDQCPKDLLWEDPAWVVEAAHDVSGECAHAREYDAKLNSIHNALESGEQSGIAEGHIETEVGERIRQRALVKRER